MAKNQIKLSIDFDVNKTPLENLKTSLKEIQHLTNSKEMGAKLFNTQDATIYAQKLSNLKEAAGAVELALQKAYNPKLGTYDIEKFNSRLKESGYDLKELKDTFYSAGQAGINTFANLNSTLLSTNVEFKKTTTLIDKMADTLKRTIGWTIASSAIHQISGSVQEAYGYVKSLDGSLNDIMIVTQKSADEMDKFAVKANNAAKSLGTATTNYTNASLTFYQQGLNDAEVEARTDLTLKVSNASGLDASTSAEYVTAVLNGYKVGSENAEAAMDILANTGAHTASSLAELSEAMAKVSSSANTMGVSEEQLAATLATVISTTRQDAATVGTAFKTIYARISSIKTGAEDAEVTLGQYTQKMADLGINVLDSTGGLRDLGEVMEEIGGKWKNLTREQRIYLAQTMAGTRQYNNLMALFENWDEYGKALNYASNATGTLQKQQDTYMQSTEAHLNALKTAQEDLFDSLIDTDVINNIADVFQKLFSFTANWVDALGGGINTLTALGGIGLTVFNKQIGTELSNIILKTSEADLKIQAYQEHFKTQGELQGLADKDLDAYAAAFTKIEQALETATPAEKIFFENIKKDIQSSLPGILSMSQELKEVYAKTAQELAGTSEYATYNVTKELADQAKLALTNDDLDSFKAIGQQIQEQLNDPTQDANEELRLLNEIIDDLALRWEKVSGSLDNYREKIEKTGEDAQRLVEIKQGTQALTKALGATLQAISALRAIGSLPSIWHNDDLSTGEKFVQTLQVLVSASITAVSVINALNKTERKHIKTLSLEAVAKIANSKATLALAKANVADATALDMVNDKEKINLALKTLLKPQYIALAAAIGLVVTGIYLYTAALDENKKAVTDAADNVQKLKTRAETLTSAFTSLKDSINGWQEAMGNVRNMTSDMDGYGDAIQTANEKAKELIETYKLFDKYSIGENGLITIDQDALMELQKTRLTAVNNANTSVAVAQLDFYNKTKAYELDNFTRDINKTLPGYLNTEQIKNVADIFKNLENTSVEDSFAELGNISLSQIDILKQSALKFENLNASLDSADSALQYFAKELNTDIVKSKYSDQLIQLSTDKNGILDSNKLERLSSAAGALLSNNISALNFDAHAFEGARTVSALDAIYSLYATDQTGSVQDALQRIYGTTANNFDDIVRAQLATEGKTVTGLTFGKGQYKVSWDDGTNGTYDLQTIQTQLANDLFADILAQTSELPSDAIENILAPLSQSTQRFGADWGNALLDSIAANNKEIDLTSILGNLTTAEVDKVQQLNDDDLLALFGLNVENAQALLDTFGVQSVEELVQKIKDTLQKQYNEEAANQSADQAGVAHATEFKLDVDEFKVYRELLADTHQELANNREALNDVAIANKRMQKGVGEIAKDWDKYNKVMSNSKASLEDISSVLPTINTSLADVLNLSASEFKLLPDDFAQKNWKLINDVINGVEGAVDTLRDKAGEEILLNIVGEAHLPEVEELNKVIAAYDLKDLTIGVEIDDANFVTACQAIIDKAGMTAEQARAYFASMGYNAEVVEENVPETYTYSIPNVTWKDGIPYLEEGQDETRTITVSQNKKVTALKAITPSGSYGGNIAVQTTAPASTRPKTSGSKSKKTTMDKVDDLDKYYTINHQIDNSNDQLKALQGQQKNLTGTLLADNLKQQLAIVEKEQGIYDKKIGMLADDISASQKQLADAYGFVFNGDDIANYDEIVGKVIADVNAKIERFNQLTAEQQTEAEKTEVENAKKFLSELLKNVDNYDKLVYNEMFNARERLAELMNQAIEKRLEILNAEVQITFDIKDAKDKWLDFQDKINEFISKEWNQSLNKAITSQGKLNNTLTTGVIEATREKYERAATAVQNFANGQTDSIYSEFDENGNIINNVAKAKEDLKKYGEELMKYTTDILQAQADINKAYLESINNVKQAYDEQVKFYDFLNKQSNHQIKLMQLLYGDKAYDKMSDYYKNSVENEQKKVNVLKEEQKYWQKMMNDAEEGTEEYKIAMENFMSVSEEAESAIEALAQALKDEFLNSLNVIAKAFEDTLTNGMGLDLQKEQLDIMKKNTEMFYDDINSAYQLSNLDSKWTDAINNTSNIKNQQKLNALREEQMEMLREKDKLSEYDIKRAEKELEIAQKQIALEEAQKAKNSMRLVRDANGNYTYQYTSDQDAINKAQQDLATAENELYNLDKNEYINNLSDMQAAAEEFQKKLLELGQKYTEGSEEYTKARQTLEEEYYKYIEGCAYKTQNSLNNLHQSAVSEYKQYYTEPTQKAFEDMTAAEIDAWLGKESGLVPQVLSGTADMARAIAADDGESFKAAASEAFSEITAAGDAYREKLVGEKDSVLVAENEVTKAINAQAKDIEKTTRDNIGHFKDQVTEIGKIKSEVDKVAGSWRDCYNELSNYLELLGANPTVTDTYTGITGTPGDFKPDNGSGSPGGGQNGGGQGPASPEKPGGTITDSPVYIGKTKFASEAKAISAALFNGVEEKNISNKIKIKPANENLYVFDGNLFSVSELNAKKRQGVAIPDLSFLKRFNTGGYTGEWGNSGKLAMLHQKELVLNQTDTKNLLGAVNIMRNIADNIGANALAKMASLSQTRALGGFDANSLEQTVYITANFEGQTSADQIQLALSNLVNDAAQFVSQRKK